MHKLMSADPTRLARPDVPPCSDAVDEGLVGGTPEELKTDLIEILGEDAVRPRISDLVHYASDASPYRDRTTKEHRSRSGHFSIFHSQRSQRDLPGRRDQLEWPIARRRHLD